MPAVPLSLACQAGGPGGMVTVTVIAARNVGPAASEQQQRQGQQGQQGRSPSHSSSGASARSPFEFAGTPSSSGATDEPDVDPFVEMRFGREVQGGGAWGLLWARKHRMRAWRGH